MLSPRVAFGSWDVAPSGRMVREAMRSTPLGRRRRNIRIVLGILAVVLVAIGFWQLQTDSVSTSDSSTIGIVGMTVVVILGSFPRQEGQDGRR